MSEYTLVHLSDLHFGRPVDLAQIRAVERLVPALAPDAVVLSGDTSQRSRHGEYQRGLMTEEERDERVIAIWPQATDQGAERMMDNLVGRP